MEHQTNSFIGSANAGLVAHELAHQWFGDKVTCGSWSDLWLNEGFATYMEYVYVALSNPLSRLLFLQNWKNDITAVSGGSVFVSDTANVGRLFDGRLTYRKGGYVLHMLRWKLGDSTFFRGVRRYLNDPLLAYKTARTADLQRNLEAESGQSLATFFNDWIYGEGYPSYHAEWSLGRGSAVSVTLSQTTSHPSVPFYAMPVPLQFRSASRDTILRVTHSRNGETFNIDPGFIPDTLIIDPQLHLLTRMNTTRRVAGVSPTLPYTVFPNPARGFFSVAVPGSNTLVQVFNAAGQLVYTSTGSTGGDVRVSTAGWAAGVYWMQVLNGNARVVRPVLVTQ
jgi:aminopeptidase N